MSRFLGNFFRKNNVSSEPDNSNSLVNSIEVQKNSDERQKKFSGDIKEILNATEIFLKEKDHSLIEKLKIFNDALSTLINDDFLSINQISVKELHDLSQSLFKVLSKEEELLNAKAGQSIEKIENQFNQLLSKTSKGASSTAEVRRDFGGDSPEQSTLRSMISFIQKSKLLSGNFSESDAFTTVNPIHFAICQLLTHKLPGFQTNHPQTPSPRSSSLSSESTPLMHGQLEEFGGGSKKAKNWHR